MFPLLFKYNIAPRFFFKFRKTNDIFMYDTVSLMSAYKF